MNLLNDAWIPVIRRGTPKRVLIRPYEITEGIDVDPFCSIDAKRPDFKSSYLQFLIGIIQTVMTPQDEVEWVRLFCKPPSKEQLFHSMQKDQRYFDLIGDEISFMQEPNLNAGRKPIANLLIESPGENTLEQNTDHFVKSVRGKRWWEACTRASLYTLKTNEPASGAGIRTSLREGGLQTGAMIPDGDNKAYETLWHLVWLNVLISKDLERTNCTLSLQDSAAKFPWAGDIRISKGKGTETTAKHIHPFQTYWGMPRRTKLSTSEVTQGTCDVCGTENTMLYQSYESLPYGLNYGEGIIHPLSPYYSDKDGLKLPVHPQPGGFTYRHWPLYIMTAISTNPRPLTLQVIDNRLKDLAKMKVICGIRVQVFGYDMDNLKARCWYESMMPYWLIPEENREELVEFANRLAEAASAIAKNTSNAVKESWLDSNSKARGDLSYLENEIWSSTENEYYRQIHVLEEMLCQEDYTHQSVFEEWVRYLNRISLQSFDTYADQVPLDSGKSKSGVPRVVKARNDLIWNNTGKKVREKILGLPARETNNKKEDM